MNVLDRHPLNSTTPPVKEEPPPPHYRLRHQDPAREEVDHPHPHYASGLMLGASLAPPLVDAPSSSLSSSPAPSSPATEAGSLLHVHQQTAHQERGHSATATSPGPRPSAPPAGARDRAASCRGLIAISLPRVSSRYLVGGCSSRLSVSPPPPPPPPQRRLRRPRTSHFLLRHSSG